MNRFFSTLFIIFLTVLALAASVLMIPAKRELALLYLKDKHYQKAEELFDAEFLKGHRDPFILLPLIELRLHFGQINEAIQLMELFVETQPNSVKALRLLSKYYQYGQRFDQYLQIEERLYRLDPSPVHGRQLARIYNQNGYYDKQIALLESMIKHDQAEKDDYLDLFKLYSYTSKHKQAFYVLQSLQKRFGRLQQEQLIAALHLFFRHDGVSQADLKALVLRHCQDLASIDENLVLAQSLYGIGQTDLARQILSLAQFESLQHPGYLRLRWEMGDDIAEAIEQLEKQEHISAKFSALIFDYRIKNKKLSGLRDLLQAMDLRAIREAPLIECALLLKGQERLAQDLLDIFEENHLYLAPLAKALLILRSGGSGESLSQILMTQDFSDEEKRYVIFWAIREDQSEFLNDIKESFFDPWLFNEQETEEIVHLFIKRGYQAFGAKVLQKQGGIYWALCALADQQYHALSNFVRQGQDESVLLKLALFMEENGLYQEATLLGEEIFQRLLETSPKAEYRLLLANFYFNTGRFEQALPLYRSLRQELQGLDSMYRYCLVKLIDLGASHHEELKMLIEWQLSQDTCSVEELRSIAFIYWNIFSQFEDAKKLFFKIVLSGEHSKQDEDNLLYLAHFPKDQDILHWFEDQALSRLEILHALSHKIPFQSLKDLFVRCEKKGMQSYEFYLLYFHLASSDYDLVLAEHALRALNPLEHVEKRFDLAQKADHLSLFALALEIAEHLNPAPEAFIALMQWKLGQHEMAAKRLQEAALDGLNLEQRLLAHWILGLTSAAESRQRREHFETLVRLAQHESKILDLPREVKIHLLLASAYIGAIESKVLFYLGHTELLDLYYGSIDLDMKALAKRTARVLYERFPNTLSLSILQETCFDDDPEQALFLGRLKERGSVHRDQVLAYMQHSELYAAEAMDWIKQALKGSHLDLEKRRYFVFLYLEFGGNLDDVIEDLYAFANDQKADSQAVKDLLYYLGPLPGKRAIEWMKLGYDRAQTKQEAMLWARYLFDRGADFVQIFGEFQNQWSLEFQELYLRSLLSKKNQVQHLVERLLNKQASFDQMQLLQTIAMQAGLEDLQERILKAMIDQFKRPLSAYRDLGVLAFQRAQYSRAKALFDVYFSKELDKWPKEAHLHTVTYKDLEALVYFAEVLNRNHQLLEANKYYKKAYRYLNGRQSIDALLLKANVMGKLGQEEEGLNILQSLVKKYPDNKRLILVFAHFLMDMGRFEEAARILKFDEDIHKKTG